MSRLKSSGVLNYGFREEIAETMVASCRAVAWLSHGGTPSYHPADGIFHEINQIFLGFFFGYLHV